MSVQNIGYIRVSSVGQNTERQLADVALDRVFEDFTSGKNTDRPQLKECINHFNVAIKLVDKVSHCGGFDTTPNRTHNRTTPNPLHNTHTTWHF